MGRLSRQYVESVCEFWGFRLIRHEITENRKKSCFRYSVIDGDGNFLTRKQELGWALMFVNDYVKNTKDFGMSTWVCKHCKQINFNNQTCMECQQSK